MPPPLSYTSDALKAFLIGRHPDVFDMMVWSSGSPVMDHMVNGAVRRMGVATIEEVQNAARLELAAIVEMWSVMASNAATRLNGKTPSGDYDMADLYKHAVEQLKLSEEYLAEYDAANPSEGPSTADVVQIYEVTAPLRAAPSRWW